MKTYNQCSKKLGEIVTIGPNYGDNTFRKGDKVKIIGFRDVPHDKASDDEPFGWISENVFYFGHEDIGVTEYLVAKYERANKAS